MTEAQWLACTDPRPILRSVNRRWRAAARRGETVNFERFRLFACACARRLWDLLDDAHRRVIELLEDYARNGRSSLRDMNRLYRQTPPNLTTPGGILSVFLTIQAAHQAAGVLYEACLRV